MDKKTEPGAFFLSFVGEYVQIITNVKFSSAGSKQNSMPLIIEGVVLDADDDYIYLSRDGDEIGQALKNDVVVYVQIMGEAEPIATFFDDLPDVKKKDMN